MIKRRLFFLVFVLAAQIILSDSDDAFVIHAWCEYTSGDFTYGTADDICNDEVLNIDFPLASCECSVSSGDCLEEGDVYYHAESNCEEDGWNQDLGNVAYNVNWDADSVDCSCLGGTWFNDLGSSTSFTYDWCCLDDGASDDWATYSGTLTTTTTVSCRRCLNGADQGTGTLYGNGYAAGNPATSKSVLCYTGDITCTSGSSSNGASATRYGNGYVAGAVCYYGDISCSDGSSSNGASCVLDTDDICGDALSCFDCTSGCYKRMNATQCYSSCSDDTRCSSSCTCDGGACIPMVANGAVCDEESDCISGDCNPSASGTSYCTASGFECARTDTTGMDTGDLECYSNDIYSCNGENNVGLSIDCSTSASIDSDSGDVPLTAGFVTDYNDACAGIACTSNQRRDTCSGESLTEYLANGATFSSSITDCNTYDTCVSGQATFRDYICNDGVNDYCAYTDFDRDTDISYCLNTSGTCIALMWPGSGGQNNCCGDDGTENLLNESLSALRDTLDSSGCCAGAGDCVDDGACYVLSATKDIDTAEILEDSGIDTNDLEVCAGLNQWEDQDSIMANCLSTWMVEGEAGVFGGYESAAGTDTECCGDDLGEYLGTEQGAFAVPATSACCDNATDCVNGSVCYIQGSCLDTGSLASSVLPEEYCHAGIWLDQDNSTDACNCGLGFYNIGGDVSQCCGDDASEYRIQESDSAMNDGSNSDACCSLAGKCVDDNLCFNTVSLGGVYYREIDEGLEYAGGLDTNDLEICANSGNDWFDADVNSSYCDDAREPDGDPLSCSGGCWRPDGETIKFGGYDSADVGVQTECCGDDTGEYMIVTNKNEACCNVVDDFVFASGNCSAAANRRYIYGTIYGEQADSTFAPLFGARVTIKTENFYDVNLDDSLMSGQYNISVPAGANYTIIITKPGYSMRSIFVNALSSVELDFNLTLTNDCRSDCSAWDFSRKAFVCKDACEGMNGCDYNESIVSDYTGQDISLVCDAQVLGWSKQHNSTHDIICCNGGYMAKNSLVLAEITYAPNVKNAHTSFLGTVYFAKEGKFYGVYVIGATLE